MNLRRVASILGLVLWALAAAELVPLLLCLVPLDVDSARGFGIGALAAFAAGTALRTVGDRGGEMYRREGVLVVVGAWLLASLAGAVPYVASGAIPSAADAIFESASGFTTTGASILTDVESLSRPLLFWRSLTQWLGGIGIVVLFVALLAELGAGARFVFDLEVPGPKAEVLHARVRQTALALFRIYLALTTLQIALMLLCGAGVYDALVHTFSTVSTGGFSPYNASVGHFSTANQAIVLIFMLAAGANFSLYYAAVRQRDLSALRDLELRVYGAIAAAATILIAIDFATQGAGGANAGADLLAPAFQVASILTTTGFSTADFAQWPEFSRVLLVALMFAGGCAGSTSGGTKLIRVMIGTLAALREVRLTFSPNSVIAVSLGGKAVPEASVRAVVALLVLWFLGWGIGTVVLAVGDTDVLTAGTASIATLSNIGPGLGAVGPTGNFAAFASWQKLVMVLMMWLGRLEFFAVLALLQPRFWRH